MNVSNNIQVVYLKLKVTVVHCIYGILALDDNQQIVDTSLFPKTIENHVSLLQQLQNNTITEELTCFLNGLIHKQVTHLVFENQALASKIREKITIPISVETPSNAGTFVRNNLWTIAKNIGYLDSVTDAGLLLNTLTTQLSRRGIRKKSEKKDQVLTQAIMVLDDLDKTYNLFTNRVKEWYGLYFPELAHLLSDNDTYIRLVTSLLTRDSFTIDHLEKEGVSSEKAKQIAQIAQTSMGGQIDIIDLKEIQRFTLQMPQLLQRRRALERYVLKVMTETAPNLLDITGPTLGARLIASVGGLEQLAKKSASKIQVLGAEKALYRSFKTGTKPPKHGVIFQHPSIHQAPRHVRGKIARALAAKIAIASRVDCFGSGLKSKALKADLAQRIDEIKKQPPQFSKKTHPRRKRR
jgi:nucleolar protein 56